MAWTQHMRAMAEQHAVGRRQGERVAGALFPSEMQRPRHELAVLNAGELCERSVWRLVTPNALGGREHRVPAVAFLVVAIVLVAVHHDLVADFPAFHLGADGPDDTGRVRACDVIGLLMSIEHRDWRAERGPHAIVVHP